MLRWPHPELSPNALFFLRWLTVSTLIHAVGCFLLLFVYTDYNSETLLQVRSTSSEAIVRLIPFGKSRAVQAAQSATKEPSRSLSVVKKTMIKKISKKKTVQKKQSTLKKKQPVKKQKETLKKQVLEKKIQKVDQKKETAPIKEKADQKSEDVVQKNKQPVEQVTQNDVPNAAVNATTDQLIQEVTFKEFELVQLQESLQEAVARVWAPPAGMSEELVCQVALTVGWDGKLLERFVEVSSGVFVYDVAVEQALDELQMPSELWGKKVKIAFKP